MSGEKGKKPSKPFMYIVQPEISPPLSDMQSQYRMPLKPEDEEISDDNAPSEEIRVVHTEKVTDISEADQDTAETIEVSTGVDQGEGKKNRNPSKKEQKKTNKMRRFSEMPKEELVPYLAGMPPAVPKPVCSIIIQGEEFTGQIQKKKGDLYIVNIIQDGENHQISVRLDDIEAVSVQYL